MVPFIALIVMGIIITLMISSIQRKYRRFSLQSEKVEGKLIRYELTAVRNHQVKMPVVEFTTKENRTLTGKSEDSYFSSYAKIGTKVVVFYNPSHPEKFMIQGKKFRSLYITVLVGGIAFIVSGAVLLLDHSRLIHLFRK
jgi:hypothetical protein